MCNVVTTKRPAKKNELLSLLQIVNFDSDELYEELNQSAESESEEERDHRHSFNPFYRRHSGQDRKRRRRPRSNSHFLVGDDKVSLFYYSIVSHFYQRAKHCEINGSILASLLASIISGKHFEAREASWEHM